MTQVSRLAFGSWGSDADVCAPSSARASTPSSHVTQRSDTKREGPKDGAFRTPTDPAIAAPASHRAEAGTVVRTGRRSATSAASAGYDDAGDDGAGAATGLAG